MPKVPGLSWLVIQLAPVVQTLDSAIQRINHYPADKYYGNQLRLPLDSDLSGGLRYPTFEQPRPGLSPTSRQTFLVKLTLAG